MQQAAETGADATRDAAANPFLGLFQPSSGASTGPSAEPATSGAPNVAPLPNPWAPPASGAPAASAPAAGARCATVDVQQCKLCYVIFMSECLLCCAPSRFLTMRSCPPRSAADCSPLRASLHHIVPYSGGMPDFSQMMGGMGGAGSLGAAGAADAGGPQGMLQMLENPQMQEQMAQMLAMPGFLASSSPMLAVACGFTRETPRNCAPMVRCTWHPQAGCMLQDSMVQANPQLRAAVEANPGLRQVCDSRRLSTYHLPFTRMKGGCKRGVTCCRVHLQMMSNPEFVRQMLNPGTMRQMMQMQQMMGGMGAGGFPGALMTIATSHQDQLCG